MYQPPPPPPMQPPPPPPKKKRPLWMYAAGAVLGLCLCGSLAAVLGTPKSQPSQSAVVATATQPLATIAVQAATEAPTMAPAATEVLVPSTTPEPTAQATVAPVTATLAPSGQLPTPPGCTSGARYGAVCKDGSRTDVTGRGACSGHKGVQTWLTCP